MLFFEKTNKRLNTNVFIYSKLENTMSQHTSEVARLLEQINAEYESARNCMYGLVAGVAQHQFITARMERMEVLHQELRTHVGEQAIVLIAQQLDDEQTPLAQLQARPPETGIVRTEETQR
jgi:hypothetical protein